LSNNNVRNNLALILSLLGRRTIVTKTPPKSKLAKDEINVKITEKADPAVRGKSPRNLNFLGRDEKLSKWIPTTSNVYGKHHKEVEAGNESDSSYSSVHSSESSHSHKLDMFNAQMSDESSPKNNDHSDEEKLSL
jgi:hypothetical protein